MDALVIRDARPEDVYGLARAWRDAGWFAVATDAVAFRVPAEEGLDEFFAATLEGMADDEAVLVADRDGEVLGFASARIAEPERDARWQIQRELAARRLLIDAVAVAEPYRGRGVGRALVGALEAWGDARGAALAAVDGNWESGVGAGFYEAALGYRRRGLTLRKALGDRGRRASAEPRTP